MDGKKKAPSFWQLPFRVKIIKMSNLNNPSNNSNTSFKVAIAILSLFLLAAVGGIYYFSNESNIHAHKTVQLKSELSELSDEQLGLEAEISQLTTNYDTETEKNTVLEIKIVDAEEKIKGLKGRINKIKRALSKTKISNEEMQQRIAALNTSKEELFSEISALQTNNKDLTAAKESLDVELAVVNEENTQLTAQIEDLNVQNTKIQARLFTLAPAGFQATRFQIQVAGRKEKLTTKAKQARAIKVDFDLANIPAALQKEHEIYLVVTDGEGVSVTKIASTPMGVPTANGELKVEVAGMETIDLNANQKISMAFQPTDKMDAGLYNVALWSNAGYLGSAAFSLR